MNESKCLACGRDVYIINDVKGASVILDKEIKAMIVFETPQCTTIAYPPSKTTLAVHQAICDLVMKK